MGKYVLGSDIGTSGCKSIVLDVDGRVCGWALADYPTQRPMPGWAEQQPEDWFAAFCNTAKSAVRQAKIDASDIAMVCIVGITHNAVLLDKEDNVVRPAIIYTDTRCSAQVEALKEQWGDRIFKLACNTPGTLWTWPQLEWIKQHEPENWENIVRILFPKDYVRNRLTRSFVTDHVDAVGTLLYEPQKREWINEFCDKLGLSLSALPPITPSLEIVGEISAKGALASGLTEGTPVVTGTTDTAAEVFGTGITQPGQIIVKLATVGRLMVVSDGPIMDPVFLNYPHVIENLWYPGSSTKFAASAFSWLRRALWDEGSEEFDYRLMDTAAALAPPGCEGLLFHPYLDGEFAPLWDSKLRASFVGVNVKHTRSHFTRAVMEGVSFAIRDAISSIIDAGLKINEVRLIGGGAASDLWAQITSDILGQEVLVPMSADAAFGAALLAGVSAGFFSTDQDFLNQVIELRVRFQPDPSRVELYEELFSIYRETTAALESVSYQLRDFDDHYTKLQDGE